MAKAENGVKDCSDFSAAKHCRMELLLQECVDTNEKAFKHWKKTQDSMNDICKHHGSTLSLHVRNVCNGNEQHDAETASATVAAEDDLAKSSEDLIHHMYSVSKQELGSISGISAAATAHTKTIEVLRDDHYAQSSAIEQKAVDNFQKKFMACRFSV